jgi:hypothetical protein
LDVWIFQSERLQRVFEYEETVEFAKAIEYEETVEFAKAIEYEKTVEYQSVMKLDSLGFQNMCIKKTTYITLVG